MNILYPSTQSGSFQNRKETDFPKERIIDSIINRDNCIDTIVKDGKRQRLIDGNFETESRNDDDNDNMTCSDAVEFVGETKNKDSNLNYSRKAKVTKETVKRYKVIIRYIEVEDNERKIKRAIIEDILKNS